MRMEIYEDYLLKVWRTLANHKVDYITIGSYATYFHGFKHAGRDLDIWLGDTVDNRRKLRAALERLGFGDISTVETMTFTSDSTIDLGEISLDIMTDMKGLENLTFADCLTKASIAEIDDVVIPFLHINDLILNKKSVNRSKDQIDVIELEKIKKLRDEQQP